MTEEASGPCYLCRCEEIDEATIRAAIAGGARDVNDVKRRTRAGMGLCQGIFCIPAILRLVQTGDAHDPTRLLPMTARPPVRPLPLDRLAAFDVEPDENQTATKR